MELFPEAVPPKGRVYPLSQPETASMKAYIQEELAKGFIRPSTSPASAGFFFVKKKDGTLHPCIDYQGLNEVTVNYRYPLPLVPAALEQPTGPTTRHHSTGMPSRLDLCTGPPETKTATPGPRLSQCQPSRYYRDHLTGYQPLLLAYSHS